MRFNGFETVKQEVSKTGELLDLGALGTFQLKAKLGANVWIDYANARVQLGANDDLEQIEKDVLLLPISLTFITKCLIETPDSEGKTEADRLSEALDSIEIYSEVVYDLADSLMEHFVGKKPQSLFVSDSGSQETSQSSNSKSIEDSPATAASTETKKPRQCRTGQTASQQD